MTFNNGPQRTEKDNLQLPKSGNMQDAYSRLANDVANGVIDPNKLRETVAEYKGEAGLPQQGSQPTQGTNPVADLINSIQPGDPQAMQKLQAGLQGVDPNAIVDLDDATRQRLTQILAPYMGKGGVANGNSR